MITQSRPRICKEMREKPASTSRAPKSIVTQFVPDIIVRRGVGYHAVFFTHAYCASARVTRKKIAKCTRKQKMRNSFFVQNARKGASLAMAKVLLNVTFPPRLLDQSVDRPM